jgi:hypothetical protein
MFAFSASHKMDTLYGWLPYASKSCGASMTCMVDVREVETVYPCEGGLLEGCRYCVDLIDVCMIFSNGLFSIGGTDPGILC